mmetsp:Transcript_21346/g.3466  ORF Transcript_21346/g.3466 Transcript_21346/m.3466 type:complete len:107 (-) Transcript_21346:264-584(-)|eukprot:CAMPEP_0168314016 /NCGR_PEP_ID=MMETSP0210-20121227/5848_1 /TAXON_ID=40633 /ORGANISM="Condylostoma magnum, Strain COL2" /LENGTH=106 /DNA_ID=CAMNT_0008277809 /DNA_START=1078 /DNA_END=1398 /DNA_ORIENTATION=-
MNLIKNTIPREAIIVSEGMFTMDVARTMLPSYFPRKRLDAGTWGTMGIGLPFAIAAKACFPDLQVYCVLGDSAFGFSAMEFETAIRHNLNIQIFVVNNNGISFGVD